MATLLAPYNNAMRLGQGFNSYTQQMCLNDAVASRTPTSEEADREPETSPSQGPDGDAVPTIEASASGPNMTQTTSKVVNNGVSQIVSYSSRFVEKLSDMTDAMNISASLSIKTATIGGKASGNYIDSDKFKESDMCFFVQVKVVNQRTVDTDYVEFQNIEIPADRFSEVYGDTFISGFEEGGELNALITVKVADKSQVFAIKAELEASLGTPVLTGEIKSGVDVNKSEMKSSTETTITVNWSGGGQIKPQDTPWNIDSLTLAASNFPELVSKTPQRIYAILTKYTALKSFHKARPTSSVLSYENAGIYTSALLDAYMDYKAIWKQIQTALFELQGNGVLIEEAKVPEEISAHQKKLSNGVKIEEKSTANGEPAKFVLPTVELTPFTPTLLGLERARTACRCEMIKIVSEVDDITGNPSLALDPNREHYLLSPHIFKRLLPVVTFKPPEDGTEGFANPMAKNAVILGVAPQTVPTNGLFDPESQAQNPMYPDLERSVKHNRAKGQNFCLGSTWGGALQPSSRTIFFNDLDLIDSSYILTKLSIWDDGKAICGITLDYANAKQITHGTCKGPAKTIWDLAENQAFCIIRVMLTISNQEGLQLVTGIKVLDEHFIAYEHSPSLDGAQETTVDLNPPEKGFWTFRGFWGSWMTTQSGISALGAVWCIASGSFRTRTVQGLPSIYSDGKELPLHASQSVETHKNKGLKYRMTYFGGNLNLQDSNQTYFNDLDVLGDDWYIAQITFFYSHDRFFTGYKTLYQNGEEIERGKCSGQSKTTPKLTGRKASGAPIGFSQALVSSTLTSEYDKNVVTAVRLVSNRCDIFELICPRRDRTEAQNENHATLEPPGNDWVLRGFWGYSGEALDRLGIIWGKN